MAINSAKNDNTRKRWPRILLAGVASVAAAAFFVLGGGEWLTLETAQNERARLLAYAESHFWTLLVAWALACALAVALSLPGATVLSLATGFVFGRAAGTAIIIVAATVGATLLFLAARHLFAVAAHERLQRNTRAARLLAGFERGAFHYLLFLRLVPLFPFWLINLAAAFTGVRLRTYVVATAVGIAPGSFVYANLGRALGEIRSLDHLLSPEVLAALGLLALLALAPVWFKAHGTGAHKEAS
jgi:uncharacterized membrane protein YdjX (TVP38/TMEM64 family)